VWTTLNLALEAPNYYPVIAKTHWDPSDPDHLRCGFSINYSFSMLKAFKAIDGASVEHSMYMMYDPSGSVDSGTFTGKWKTFDATMQANVQT
jgi:hypothetical protein